MTKVTLLLLGLILSLNFAFSQTNSGFRLGLNISNLDFKDASPLDNEHRNGVVFGYFVEYSFNDSFSIMPEIQYSAEGAKEKPLRANYIQLPIQLRFVLGDNFKIGFGPQFGLKTWAFEDNHRNLVFSAMGGIQYNISDMFFLDARYTYGFSNIYDDDFGYEAKNQNIQFGIGIKAF